MNVIPFPLVASHPTAEEARLATWLRALAAEIEGGDVRQIVVTVIRQDGQVQSVGVVPGVIRTL